MARSSDIAAYTFAADLYAPSCIVDAVTSSEAFDGWALADGVMMSVEDNLSEIAVHFQIERMEEDTFDSNDFPKVIFLDSVDESDSCACGTQLGDH